MNTARVVGSGGLAGAILPAVAAAGLAAEGRRAVWPMYCGDAQRTGQSRFKRPAAMRVKWEVKQGSAIVAAPIVDRDGTLYVIAVHPSEELPVAPTFKLPAGASYKRADALFEDRSVKLSGNTFGDLFQPLDVHVYRYISE